MSSHGTTFVAWTCVPFLPALQASITASISFLTLSSGAPSNSTMEKPAFCAALMCFRTSLFVAGSTLEGVENVVLDAHDCAPVEILDEEVLEVAVGAGPDGFELLVLAPCEKSVDDEWIVFARTEGASPDDAVVTGLSKSYCSMSWRVTPDGEFLFDPSCVRRVAVLRDEVDEGSEVVGSCIRCGRHVAIRGAVAILLLSHDMHVVAADKRHKVERGDVIRGSVKN